MERFVIRGGKKLKGKIKVMGAKNAFSKHMVASLMSGEAVTILNCPDTVERELTSDLLRNVGARVRVQKNGVLTIDSSSLRTHRVSAQSRKNRIPILAIAPLLHRLGRAEVPFCGGDAIGARPVNFHIDILKKMGAKVTRKNSSYSVKCKKLRGTSITLPYTSVGATETGILAGALAKGTTVLKNAASEPEVMDLIMLLQKMGALIELDVNRVIRIEGVKKLGGARHYTIPDRIEAASLGVLAVATESEILVEGALQTHLITFLNAIRRVGGDYNVEKNGIRFFRKGPLKPLAIETAPHPGFMTDWQQPFAVLLMLAEGKSTIHETVYEDRLGYAEDFKRMGADIKVLGKCIGKPCRFAKKSFMHSMEIRGPASLAGAGITVSDIRAGLAQVVAALAADGVSEISGVHHIDRGYENIDRRLRKIGADISRVNA